MVYFPRVVLAEEDAAPCGLDGINVVPGVRIDEVDAVVHGEVRETVSVEIAVRTPAVTDDHCAWFDPVMYDGHQCVGGSVRYRNKKCSTGPSFTARHPLTLNRVSPMVLPSPTYGCTSYQCFHTPSIRDIEHTTHPHLVLILHSRVLNILINTYWKSMEV